MVVTVSLQHPLVDLLDRLLQLSTSSETCLTGQRKLRPTTSFFRNLCCSRPIVSRRTPNPYLDFKPRHTHKRKGPCTYVALIFVTKLQSAYVIDYFLSLQIEQHYNIVESFAVNIRVSVKSLGGVTQKFRSTCKISKWKTFPAMFPHTWLSDIFVIPKFYGVFMK